MVYNASMEILPVIRLTASPAVDAAIIVLASAVAALLVDLFVTRVVARLVSSTSSDVDDKLIAALHRPVFLTVFLLGTELAMRALELPLIYFNIVETLLVLIWSVAVIRIAGVLFDNLPRIMQGGSSAGRHLGTLLKNVTVVVVLTMGAMGVLTIWDVSIAPLLASAGIVGAAVAFAAKDTIANFLGGISVLADRPYSVGHYIILESGERGEVVDIGLRSTRVKTRDDILVTVPNSVMATSKIINESAPIKRFRIRLPVGVAYGSDTAQVETILQGIAASHEGVEKTPEPRVRFRAFGDSSLNFELLCWVDHPMNKGKIIHELNLAIYEKFGEEGVQIPFPQRDVHLHQPQG
jgi:small-conductance mechanosensitive channel